MGIFRGTGGTGDSTTDTTVTTVTEKAAEAASSATSAANSATSAANSASAADASATIATNAKNATTTLTDQVIGYRDQAQSYASDASAARGVALTAQAAAETAEANAVTAKNQAVSAKDNAVTAQTAAETAETNAETAYANTLAIYGSTTDVQNAVDDAEKLAINPEDSQYTLSDAVTTGYSALHYAAKAEDYKTAAEVSKNAAETAETAAETAQGLAETAKTAAETAQSAAETAQAAAELAQSNAETVYDNFDDRYLGNKSGDPLVDNDNDGLTTGTLYFNTTENEMRVYTGTAWVPVQELSGDQTVNSLTSNNNVVVKGNLEVQGTTITVDSATAQTIDLGDNDKIRLGDSDDLQIYHSGTHSYISDQGTGNLIIEGAHFLIQTPNAEKILQGLNNGAVSLYYDGATKLDTTSSGVDITGNITVSGTVDGRDIATDGATLDAVASTYVDVSGDTMTGDLAFGDNVKAKFGASDDLQIYHDGSNSYVSDQGTGNLRILANNLRIQNSTGSQNLIAGDVLGEVSLYYNNSKKLATTSSGVDVTGTVVADGLTVDGDGTFDGDTSKVTIKAFQPKLIFDDDSAVGGGSDKLILQSVVSQANGDYEFVINNDQTLATDQTILKFYGNGDISFYEDTGTTAKLTWDASAEELQFKDNVKAEFGDGGDLQIYHNGSASFIDDGGTGDLNIRANNLGLRNISGDYYIYCTSGGAVSLRHNNSVKLATTSTGIDVTGTVTADGLTVAGSTLGQILIIDADGTNQYVYLQSNFGQAVINSQNGTNYGSIALKAYNGTAGLNRLLIANNGDISFYDDAGTSQDFYWDASTSRLGLGTTSPSTPLHVNAGTTDSVALFESTDNTARIQIKDNGGFANIAVGNGNLFLQADQGNAQVNSRIEFDVDGSEAMRIDSSGNVGIGTTSPSTKLDVEGVVRAATGSEYTDLKYYGVEFNRAVSYIRPDTDGTKELFIGWDGVNRAWNNIYLNSTTSTRFHAGASEAMRIDSSGNLLVGTTSSLPGFGNTTTGHSLQSGGFVLHSRNGGTVAYMNRNSSDGTIVDFRKDGSTVGSIGTFSNDAYIATNDTGLRFIDSVEAITPFNGTTVTNRDAAISLGLSSYRFTDLYLSGGVYLGGTGADNLLDDYEEGTFNPVLTMTTSGDMTATANGAIYTKVGRMVHFAVYFNSIDGTSPTPSGQFRLTGLPFTSVSGSTYTAINISYNNILVSANDKPYSGYISPNTTYIRFNEGNTTFVTQGGISAATGRQIMVSGVYQTT